MGLVQDGLARNRQLKPRVVRDASPLGSHAYPLEKAARRSLQATQALPELPHTLRTDSLEAKIPRRPGQRGLRMLPPAPRELGTKPSCPFLQATQASRDSRFTPNSLLGDSNEKSGPISRSNSSSA